ncbi:unnamed protein product [Urochloa decumbens]|uniref:Uncharacterized protein n=1 Tax=Urochloa decumbens TaxID=240449 RepID=A0ABC9EW19_9POAL
MASSPALKLAALAMLVLFAEQLLAATPADGRVLPAAAAAAAAGRSLREDVPCTIGPCEAECTLFCKPRCVLQSDGSQKCNEFCVNFCKP